MDNGVAGDLADIVEDDDILSVLDHGDGAVLGIGRVELEATLLTQGSGELAVLGDLGDDLLVAADGSTLSQSVLILEIVMDDLHIQHLAGQILLVHEDDVVAAFLQIDGVGILQGLLVAIIGDLNQPVAVGLGVGGDGGGDIAGALNRSGGIGADQLAVPGVEIVDMGDGILGEDAVVDDLLVVEVHNSLAGDGNGDLAHHSGGIHAVDLACDQLEAVGDGLSHNALAQILGNRAACHACKLAAGGAVDGDGDGLIVVVDGDSAGTQGDILLVDKEPGVVALAQVLHGGGIGLQSLETLTLAGVQHDALTDEAGAENALTGLYCGSPPVTGHALIVDRHDVGAVLIIDLVVSCHAVVDLALVIDLDGGVGAGLEDDGQISIISDLVVLIALILRLGGGGEAVTGLQAIKALLLRAIVDGQLHDLAVLHGGEVGGVAVENIDVGVAALIILGPEVIIHIDDLILAGDGGGIALIGVEGIALAPALLGGGVLLPLIEAGNDNILDAVIQALANLNVSADDDGADLAGFGIGNILSQLHGDLGKGAPVVVDDDLCQIGSLRKLIVQVDGDLAGQFVDVQLAGVAGIGDIVFTVVLGDLNGSEGLADINIVEHLSFAKLLIGLHGDDHLTVLDGGDGLGVIMIHGDLSGLTAVNDLLKVQLTDVVGGILCHHEAQRAVILQQLLVITQLLIQLKGLVACQRIGADVKDGGGTDLGGLLGDLFHRALVVQNVLAVFQLVSVGGIDMVHTGRGDGPLIHQTSVVQVDHILLILLNGDGQIGSVALQLVLGAAEGLLGDGGVLSLDLHRLAVSLIGVLGVRAGNKLTGGQDSVGLVIVVHGDGGHDVVVVQPHHILTAGSDEHLSLAGSEVIILGSILVSVAIGSIDGAPDLHAAALVGIIQLVVGVIAGFGIILQIILDLPIHHGDLAAHAGNVEGNLHILACDDSMQAGVLIGGIIDILREALRCGIQRDGVSDFIGVSGNVALCGNIGVDGVQGPDQGIAAGGKALAFQILNVSQNDVVAHGVSHAGADAGHAADGRLGDVCKRCADLIRAVACKEPLRGTGDVLQIGGAVAVTHSIDGGAAAADLAGNGGRQIGGVALIVLTAGNVGEAGALSGVMVRLAVAEQDQILGAGTVDLVHGQAVAAQHQSAVDIGAVAVFQIGNAVANGLQIALILDVQPVANQVCVLVEGHNGNIDSAAVALGEAVQEAAVLSEDLLDGFQTGVTVPSAVAGAAVGTLLHGGGVVDDQLNRRAVGGHSFGGNDLQRDIKGVLAGLLDGLADGIAVLLVGLFVGDSENLVVLVELIITVHDLIIITGSESM